MVVVTGYCIVKLADTCVSIEFERNLSMAEREGFEPSLGLTLLTV